MEGSFAADGPVRVRYRSRFRNSKHVYSTRGCVPAVLVAHICMRTCTEFGAFSVGCRVRKIDCIQFGSAKDFVPVVQKVLSLNLISCLTCDVSPATASCIHIYTSDEPAEQPRAATWQLTPVCSSLCKLAAIRAEENASLAKASQMLHVHMAGADST